MVNRADFDAVKAAMASAGFVYHEVYDVHMFLDGPAGRPRDAVHILFAREKVRSDYPAATPDLSVQQHEAYKLLDLEPLVRMKLTSFRRKDQVHLLDLIGVGLLDQSWATKYPALLASRLQELLDDPDG